jgi:hypothetical protein
VEDDAKAYGGLDQKMQWLVGLADAIKEEENCALGTGVKDNTFEELTLSHIETYYTCRTKESKPKIEREKGKRIEMKSYVCQGKSYQHAHSCHTFLQNGRIGNSPKTLSQQDCFLLAAVGTGLGVGVCFG